MATVTNARVFPAEPQPADGLKQAKGRSPQVVVSLLMMACGILITMNLVQSVHPSESVQLSHATITLSLFAGLAFTAIASLLSMWMPTRTVGEVLASRVINSPENWQKESLRSFVELGIWLGVMWTTFDITGHAGIALVYATMSGVVAALTGESLTVGCRALEQQMRRSLGESDEQAHSLASGSLLMLCIYGSGGLSYIYQHVSDIALAGLLTGVAGAAILAAGRLASSWLPTRKAGLMLQDRVANPVVNWRAFPMRSATEFSVFSGVTIGVYAEHQELLLAVQAGFLVGILVCLAGEAAIPSHATKEDSTALAFAMWAVVWGTASYCHWIFTDIHVAYRLSFLLQLALAVLFGACINIGGRLFVSREPTKRLGRLLQQRLVNAPTHQHWVSHPLRSCLEAVGTTCLTLAAWHITANLRITVGACIASLLAFVMFGEALLTQQPLRAPSPPPPQSPLSVRRRPLSEPQATSEPCIITNEELATHNKDTDCWIAVHGHVYDVSSWHHLHPGGPIIMDYAGQDASDQFELFHPPAVAHKLRRFRIGKLDEGGPAPSAATLEYRQLRRQLWAEGAFVPRYSYFVGRQLIVFGFFAAALLCLFALPSHPLLHYLVAPSLLGIALQQAAFMAHDVAHNGLVAKKGITTARRALLCFNGGVLLGVSGEMWLREHNMHHAYTLRPHADPQFMYFPLWLQTLKEVPFWRRETAGLPVFLRKAIWNITRALVRIQHVTWLPLSIVVGRFNFLALSVASAVKHYSAPDVFALALHFSWYIALLSVLPGWQARLLFTLVHYSIVGILHVQLLVSHLMTNQFTPEEEAKLGFFQFQLLTTRNLTSDWSSAWFHGGLEMQIEHHLFPQLPRHALPEVAPRVRALAKKHGIPYVEVSFLGAVTTCLGGLQEMSTALLTLDFL